MSGKTASRVERVIAFYGLDHMCWSEESVEVDAAMQQTPERG